ncbi:MAG: glutamine--fructose-6-phosphate transaminase (isomerizing) [Candidatus Adiutrix sp.]|jgi:glucosamine--fructose-6-phosphate aminotransferase (isomerizing)|nr:glutamine--fructose-6-phosphate transaminase (isomerizing) [Candidatus Adiutrix sp.]
MCGIIGLISQRRDVVPDLVAGLKRLEYRGYDSAGVATLGADGRINRRRAPGKLSALEDLLRYEPVSGSIGLGHTRWATHGAPSQTNAHPHATAEAAVVHNGIIENFQEIKSRLLAEGHHFETQTDSEAVVHLVTSKIQSGLDPVAAVRATLPLLEGAFALVFIFAGQPELMIGARRGSPLALGYGDGEMALGSDALAIGPLCHHLTYLEDGDWVVIDRNQATIYDARNNPVERSRSVSSVAAQNLGKGGYRHYMLKEIHEQPQVMGDTLNTMVDPVTGLAALPNLPELKRAQHLTIVACGTSYYAALIGKYWIERMARLPVAVEVASEFRYRDPVLLPGQVALFISQSGETADTLAALRLCRQRGQGIMSIVNVQESTIARESDIVLPTVAGPEFGVASTKAFTAQLTLLAALALVLASHRGHLERQEEIRLVRALMEAPALAADILSRAGDLDRLARDLLAPARDVLFLGRGSSFPIALEGALKLKEISYIHAEGYAAGEIKHGPIALVDENVPVIVVAPSDDLFAKTASNLSEVNARGGRTIFIGDQEGLGRLSGLTGHFLMPKVEPLVAPLIYALPVQLLAYYAAVAKGTDVDQPRNLAKSVTVE